MPSVLVVGVPQLFGDREMYIEVKDVYGSDPAYSTRVDQ